MKHQITVVPIGPGSPSLLTLHAADLLRSGKQILFRTARHPVAAWLQAQQIPFSSLDELYEAAEDFDSMNAAIVQAVLRLWKKSIVDIKCIILYLIIFALTVFSKMLPVSVPAAVFVIAAGVFGVFFGKGGEKK